MRAFTLMTPIRVAILACIPAFGCSKGTTAADAAAAAPSAAAIGSSSDAGAIAKAKTYERHEAELSTGKLRLCLDSTLEVVAPPDAGANWKPPASLLDHGDAGTTEIEAACAEQFADRVVLATCVEGQPEPVAMKDGSEMKWEFRWNYYDFALVGPTDKYMNSCLKNKGKWKALSRTSDEWQRAKLEYERDQLRKGAF